MEILVGWKNRKRQSGVTLIELLVSLGIVAILGTVAVPGFSGYIDNTRVKGGSQELLSTLMYARSEAIKRNSDVYVVSNNGSWENGWAISILNGKTYNQCISSSAMCLKIQEAYPNVSVNTASSMVVYRRTGQVAAPANFEFCDAGSSAEVTRRILTVDLSGRPLLRRSGTC